MPMFELITSLARRDVAKSATYPKRLISALKPEYERDLGTLKDAGNLANRSLNFSDCEPGDVITTR
jgi:hypothetical protein